MKNKDGGFMKNKRSPDILFLSGIILMCFGYLNYMIKPTWIDTSGDFGIHSYFMYINYSGGL